MASTYLDYTSKQYGDDISIEIGILQNDITLPELPTEKLSYRLLKQWYDEDVEAGLSEENQRTYALAEQEYEDVIGNFYIPILFPLIENGESTELEFDAPNTKSVLNNSITANKYVERNYISLMIPKYIVLQFTKTIPAGTKFLIGFIGGSTSIENMNVIGLYGKDL